MEKETRLAKKEKLVTKIKHLTTLLEVSRGYPKWLEYSIELDQVCTEMGELMKSDKVKNEERLMKLN